MASDDPANRRWPLGASLTPYIHRGLHPPPGWSLLINQNGAGVCTTLRESHSPHPTGAPVLRRLALLFARCVRLDRQRVDGALEFRLQRRIHHAVTFDPALPFEGRRHDIDPEMRLAARPVAGVALMQM